MKLMTIVIFMTIGFIAAAESNTEKVSSRDKFITTADSVIGASAGVLELALGATLISSGAVVPGVVLVVIGAGDIVVNVQNIFNVFVKEKKARDRSLIGFAARKISQKFFQIEDESRLDDISSSADIVSSLLLGTAASLRLLDTHRMMNLLTLAPKILHSFLGGIIKLSDVTKVDYSSRRHSFSRMAGHESVDYKFKNQ